MKVFILAILTLSAFQFSLGDDWDGMEDAVKVQQDAALEIVDQLDLESSTSITQQIDDQVQQLMSPIENNKINQQKINVQKKEDEEIHSVEYWLERLGNEYADEPIILIQQPQPSITEQITSVIGNLILEGGEKGVLSEIAEISKKEQKLEEDVTVEDEPLVISGIELEFSEVSTSNSQLKELLDSAKEMQRSVIQPQAAEHSENSESNTKHNHKKNRPIIDTDFEDLLSTEDNEEEEKVASVNQKPGPEIKQQAEYEVIEKPQKEEDEQAIDFGSISKEKDAESHKTIFQPNEKLIKDVQPEKRLFNFLTGASDEETQHKEEKKQENNGYKFYSFNSNADEQRPFYDDKESAVKFYEKELPKDIPDIYQTQTNAPKVDNMEKQLPNSAKESEKQEEPILESSPLKKYLLYTSQPEVIYTGTSDDEIKKDKQLVQAFKSMDPEQSWLPATKAKSDSDFKHELFKTQTSNEAPKDQPIETKQEQVTKQPENPHKFISFKPDTSIEVTKQVETVKSKYDELPETKLQSKEEMKIEKLQRIKEMQSEIEQQLKNKKFEKKTENDRVLGYEKEYIEWEMATQPKQFQADISFLMTSNNLRKKQKV